MGIFNKKHTGNEGVEKGNELVKNKKTEPDLSNYDTLYSKEPKNNRERELLRREEEKKEKEREKKLKEKGVELGKKEKKDDSEFGEVPESEDSKMGEEVEKVLLKSAIGPYLQKEDTTDISFNGWDLYVQDSVGLHRVEDSGVTADDIQNLGRQVANISNKTFTSATPILDTAIGRYRLNFMHSSVSPFGATTAIRVSKPSLAIKDVSKLANGSIIQFLNLCMKVGENVIISGQTGSGKSLSLSEEVNTPEGIKTMGDLKVGDFVYDRLGKPSEVLGVYPQGKLDVYELELTDGRKVKASEDHIWTTITDKGKFRNYTTKEMLNKGLSMPGRNENCKRFYIPMNGAIEKSEKEFKTHPYVMGAFLGDGCLNEKTLTLSSEDRWIPNKVAKLIGSPEIVGNKYNYSWVFRLPEDMKEDIKKDPKKRSLKNFQTSMLFDDRLIGLCGTRYIPEEYFEGSIEQRYELLRGLMDTDGSITGAKSKRYTVSFSTSSEQLGKDVMRLGRSLGFKMSMRDIVRKREGVKDSRDITISFLVPNEVKHKLFSLPRKVEIGLECKGIKKKARYDRIGISKIRKLDYQEEMVCILVDNEEHLFQVGQGIITHNTEFQKFLVGYIPDNKKITLMEDTPDSHLKTIYRNKDINSWVTKKGGDNETGKVDFTALLKSALRNNPDWAIISETRGAEAKYMIDAAQTDHSVITTLHASGATMIPSRLISMVAQGSKDFNEVLLGSDITDVIKIGVHMQLDRSDSKMNRFIREVVEYTGYSEKGVQYNYIYRVINDFDEDTGEYDTRVETGPVSERFMDKLKLNKLYHKLPVYHHPLCYDSSGRFDEEKAKEIYEKNNKSKIFTPDKKVSTKTIKRR